MKIEGRNSVYELLKTDKEIDKVLVQKDLKDEPSKRLLNVIRSHKVKVQLVDKFVLDKESDGKRHQGFYPNPSVRIQRERFVESLADQNNHQRIIGIPSGKQRFLPLPPRFGLGGFPGRRTGCGRSRYECPIFFHPTTSTRLSGRVQPFRD